MDLFGEIYRWGFSEGGGLTGKDTSACGRGREMLYIDMFVFSSIAPVSTIYNIVFSRGGQDEWSHKPRAHDTGAVTSRDSHVGLWGGHKTHVQQIKYLGVILTNTFKDDMDIARQLRSLYASSNIILRKFASCSISVKIQLLESYCINFYCSSLWCNFTKQSLSKLRIAFNNVYRLILGFRKRDSASCMFVSSRIDSFEAKTRKICYTFRQRMVASTNSVIFAIHNNNWFPLPLSMAEVGKSFIYISWLILWYITLWFICSSRLCFYVFPLYILVIYLYSYVCMNVYGCFYLK